MPRRAAARARRQWLRGAAATVAGGWLPPTLQQALAMPPLGRSGTLADVAHVVVLTQENRSFDHYFGTLRGVRGFGDRFPVPLPGGRTVWQQRDRHGREVLPYRLDTGRTRALRVQGTPHTWPDAQQAWNDGRMDGWLDAKTERTMGHYTGADLAWQFALAEAFTLCDAYHCALQAGTNPNRLVLWTGHHDPQGRGGGPALMNHFEKLGPAHEGYTWTTYPERLLQAGVSWKHYQDMADNFGDNPVEGFRQYRAAAPGSALHQRALTSHPLAELAHDVEQGRLPQVSWVIAPARDSEHPDPSSPLQGAQFTARVIEALTRNPEVWGRTVLFVNYDENDGFFDHMPPPAPPSRDAAGRWWGGSTVSLDGEHHDHRGGPAHGSADDPPALHGRAYGLGPRVPMFVVSPWSRGGWVNSQVFDHSSVLRFLERRFGVAEPHISAWRRAVCGDLCSTLDFTAATPRRLALPALPPLLNVPARVAAAERLPPPQPPAEGRLPQQQRGLRPSRALPYALDVQETWSADPLALRLVLVNSGTAGAVLQVYDRLSDGRDPPRRYTVGAQSQLQGDWVLPVGAALDLHVHGPNGFFRAYVGRADAALPTLSTGIAADGRLQLRLHNPSGRTQVLTLHDHLRRGAADVLKLAPGRSVIERDLARHRGWYDLELRLPSVPGYQRRLAGRQEDGRDGISDPGLA